MIRRRRIAVKRSLQPHAEARLSRPRTPTWSFSSGQGYRERANRRPSSTEASKAGGTFPTLSVGKDLSTVMIRETLTTEGFDRPVPRTARRTFPGASARRRFDVITAAITVLILLSLKLLAETIR